MAELFADLPEQVSIDDQIACVEREIRYREFVYPKRAQSKPKSAEGMRRELVKMNAVLVTLRAVKVGDMVLKGLNAAAVT